MAQQKTTTPPDGRSARTSSLRSGARPPLGAVGRMLLVLFFCAGIAFLGLLTGGEQRRATARRGADPLAGYYNPDMPRYPDSAEVPAGPDTTVGGAALRMSFFSTADEPSQVGRFYANFWRGRRLFVREDLTHRGGVVSGLDASKGVVYQVLLNRHGERTMVFPSVTRTPLLGGQAEPEPEAPPVALYPGSRTVSTYRSRDLGAAARSHLSLNEGTLKDNLAHYQAALAEAGFVSEIHKQPPELADEQRVLLYRKGEREITINLTALDKKRVRVHMLEAAP